MRSITLSALVICLAASLATAQTNVNLLPVVNVSSDISVSTTWTANIRWNLTQQVYVLPGATLTIEAGTNIITTTGLNGAGSLAVTRGAKIFIQGTPENGVIFSTDADLATWTNGDRNTGVWREAAQEWGNLTVCGRAYTSGCASTFASFGNTENPMEGLIPQFPGDTRVLYGGTDDDDDSGEINYVSLRYGGRVVGLGNELNGLSLGALGRRTSVCGVEIMNNVDDGVEVWGGTVNFKQLSIWNIGDDSLDVDQGWRGIAQFVFIVQGYSACRVLDSNGALVNGSSGSGLGDNALEIDGAETSDYQPVTTCSIYNFTVVKVPGNNDHLAALRSNANVQYRNGLVQDMATSDRVISLETDDCSSTLGSYGDAGTFSFLARWSTPAGTVDPVNAPANPAQFYTAQSGGFLLEMSNVTFGNVPAGSFSNSNGYNAVGANNVAFNNQDLGVGNNVVRSISRAPALTAPACPPAYVGLTRVTSIDPRPVAAVAATSAPAPFNGVTVPANFRGAFDPNKPVWLLGWTSADAYGFIDRGTATPGNGSAFRAIAGFDVTAARNRNGNPVNTAGDLNGPFYSILCSGQDMTLSFTGEPNQFVILLASPFFNPGFLPLGATGTLDISLLGNFPVDPFIVADGTQPGPIGSAFRLNANGQSSITLPINALPGTDFNLQALITNTNPNLNVALTNAVQVSVY